jgi:hypothetical protein
MCLAMSRQTHPIVIRINNNDAHFPASYGVESLGKYLDSRETSNESIFDRVVTIKNLGDFDFTVVAADKL